MQTAHFSTHRPENTAPPGPPAPTLRMVYNWRDDTRLGGTTLIGTGPGVYKTARGKLALLILTALAVTVFVG